MPRASQMTPSSSPSSSSSGGTMPVVDIVPPTGMDAMQSAEQRSLFDTIDRLRNCGLGSQLSLPQIVVCGDQSAGKSSVLEALTEIQFPRADNVCTRHATEIISRSASNSKVRVRIIPDHSSTKTKQQDLTSFSESVDDFATLATALPAIIDRAKAAVGIATGTEEDSADRATFSSHTLSIEIQGPGRPQLTVVDLPGIFQNEGRPGEKALVDDLILRFIREPRAICLAVISTDNDADNQSILTRLREVDPNGSRTLGVITKPDRLPADSPKEDAFIELAQNQNKRYIFTLGWHVLKNRSFDQEGSSLQERNRLETEWFRSSNFRKVGDSFLGIKSLGTHLSKLLFDHIKKELPSIRNEIQRLLSGTEHELERMGAGRTNSRECKDYLVDAAHEIHELCKQALSGHLRSDFFESSGSTMFDLDSHTASRRLCALLRLDNAKFARDLRSHGHRFDIGDEPAPGEPNAKYFVGVEQLHELAQSQEVSTSIDYQTALTWVSWKSRWSRGRELDGQSNPLTITELYKDLSHPWQSVAADYVQTVSRNCVCFMKEVLVAVCAEDVMQNVWTSYVSEALEERKKSALDELARIMRPYRDHPINENPAYLEKIDGIRQRRRDRQEQYEQELKAVRARAEVDEGFDWNSSQVPKRKKKSIGSKLSFDTPDSTTTYLADDTEWFNSQEILDCVQSIYEVKREVFIDNVLSHVVHMHLVHGLEEVVSARWAGKLSDEAAFSLAAEPVESRHTRARYLDQVQRLQEGQQILKRVLGGGGSR